MKFRRRKYDELTLFEQWQRDNFEAMMIAVGMLLFIVVPIVLTIAFPILWDYILGLAMVVGGFSAIYLLGHWIYTIFNLFFERIKDDEVPPA
jgi:prepilin signal peptidase PulO-like enzyme (type II secretory pathway)